MNKYLFFVVCLMIYGCENVFDDKSSRDWIYEAHPRDEVEKAIRRGDFRFMGVNGYSIIAPGVHKKCLDYPSDINVIDGTSEFTTSYEDEKFNVVAEVYADFYNFLLRKYLESEKGFECDDNR